MDNLQPDQQPLPESSQSPISGSVIKGLIVVIVVIVLYRYGAFYFFDRTALNNLGQSVQQAVDGAMNKSSAPGSIKANPTTEAQDSAIQKVSTLMSCINYGDPSLRQTAEYYQKHVNFDQPQRTSFTGLIAESSWQTCDLDINKALGFASNTPELDHLTRAFQTQGRSMVAAFKEVTPYYKQKNYLDDGFAFGKAKDAQLLQQISSYTSVSDAFRDAIDKQEDINNAAELATLAQDPKAQNKVLSLQLFTESKKVMRELSKDTINASSLEVAINGLTAAQTKFKDTVLPALKAENVSGKYESWNSVNDAVDNFLAAAKDVWRLARDSKPIPTGKFDTGSAEKAIDTFNRLVDSLNRSNSIGQYQL